MSEVLRSAGAREEEDGVLADLVAEITDRLHAGERVDLAEYAGRYPERAERLRRLLPALAVMGELKSAGLVAEAVEVPGTLGDFRLVREIGRGGMGVVYEAEQISLERRVALKVLPLAATLDPRRLQRFHNEARAAAGLHHTNIVPVHAVGCERSVHYYAMQLIDGRPLSELIEQMRQAEGQASSAARAVTVGANADATPWTGQKRRDRDYYRRVAELGVQAAEGLEHAHQVGIVHRDVKPANLLLDGRGNLWISDFGLAQVQQTEGLTLTGDLVGTLRYMSPEQATGKGAPVDHRSDVYSLGVTLYELLTLRPVFEGSDRQELLRQVALEEPIAPRRLERGIPAELETIVLEAMEKNPQERYATAQELADDLRRWLDDRSIVARRPSWGRLAARWARRHKPLVGAALAVLVMAAVLGGGTWMWWAQKRAGAEGEARAALREAAGLLEEERWPEALSAARRAEGVLAGVGADPELGRQARTLVEDLEMARRLQEARLQGAALKEGAFDKGATDGAYAAAFQEYGLDVDELDPQTAAAQIRARPIHRQLVAALDDWAIIRWRQKAEGWKQRQAVARAVDPDVWRNRLRDLLEALEPKTKEDLVAAGPNPDRTVNLDVASRKTLEEVVAAGPVGDWPAPTLELLCRLAYWTSSGDRVAALLGQTQQRHPDDFWINHTLGYIHHRSRPPRLAEAIRYYSIAVALRPRSPGTHVNLSWALRDAGQLDASIVECREAIRLEYDYAEAHNNLGSNLRDKGRLEEAIAEYQEAIRLKKDLFEAHNNLGVALAEKGQWEEAIAEYRKAIRLNPNRAGIHSNLGQALRETGQPEQAIAEYKLALRLNPDLAEVHLDLGQALADKGQWEEAIAEYRKAIRLEPDGYKAHVNLGAVLRTMGRLDEAIAENLHAIRLKKDCAEAHCNLGLVLEDKGRFQQALVYLRRGHQIGSRNPRWRYPSAQWVQDCERLVELDGKFPAILSGERQPADTAERLALAQLCQLQCKKRYAVAARFYSAAFAENPQLAGDLRFQHRYSAACSAALAGCGQGKDADKLITKERAGLRKQALDWLRADLKAYWQVMDKSADKAGPEIAQRLQHWLQDSDFTGVRSLEGLGRLPEAERGAWQKLWAEVEALRQRATKPAPPAGRARP